MMNVIQETIKAHCKDAVEKGIVLHKEILFCNFSLKWKLKSIDIYSSWGNNNKALCSFLDILSGALSDEHGNTSFSSWNPNDVNSLNENGGWGGIDNTKVFGKLGKEVKLSEDLDVEMDGNEEEYTSVSRKRSRLD